MQAFYLVPERVLYAFRFLLFICCCFFSLFCVLAAPNSWHHLHKSKRSVAPKLTTSKNSYQATAAIASALQMVFVQCMPQSVALIKKAFQSCKTITKVMQIPYRKAHIDWQKLYKDNLLTGDFPNWSELN